MEAKYTSIFLWNQPRLWRIGQGGKKTTGLLFPQKRARKVIFMITYITMAAISMYYVISHWLWISSAEVVSSGVASLFSCQVRWSSRQNFQRSLLETTPVNAFPLPGDIVFPPKIVARADVRVDFVLSEDYYCNNLHNIFFFCEVFFLSLFFSFFEQSRCVGRSRPLFRWSLQCSTLFIIYIFIIGPLN